MKIYAFRVEQKGPRNLNTVLRRLHDLQIEDRFIGNLGIRLEARSNHGDFLLFDFARERTGHGPGRMRRDQPIREIELRRGEFFGEDTGMAYCPQTNYIALQYNHIGPKALLIERYLRAVDMSLGGIPAKMQGQHDEDVAGFVFGSVLKRNAYARLRRMGIYREVEFTVAVPGVLEEDLPAGRSLTNVLNCPLPEGTEKLTLKISATPHDHNSSLGGGTVREIANDLRRLGGNLLKAKIRGKAAHGERVEPIDLVQEQITREVTLPLGAGGRYDRRARWEVLAGTLQSWLENQEINARR